MVEDTNDVDEPYLRCQTTGRIAACVGFRQHADGSSGACLLILHQQRFPVS